MTTQLIRRVSIASDGTQGNADSSLGEFQTMRADGRYVAFDSNASNLVAGDTNGVSDIFVYDSVTHSTERVSVASDGTQGNWYSSEASISADGRYVAFMSGASNLTPGLTGFVHNF